MGDLGKTIIFIVTLFIMLFAFSIFGDKHQSVLNQYEPYQEVRPTNYYDTEIVYLKSIDCTITEQVKKPYVLVTASSKVGYSYDDPNFKVIDYGSYKEIDSLKCLRYKQMQWKMYHLDKLNEKSCK